MLGLEAFNEDDLYENLDGLSAHQAEIETSLARRLHGDGQTGLFLYDVTSSYFEGTENELTTPA